MQDGTYRNDLVHSLWLWQSWRLLPGGTARAEPILLVLGGLTLGYVPAVAHVEFPPEVVFLLFIPPLVYIGAYLTPWRDFKSNLRPILLLAIGLVIATIFAVAAVTMAVV